jgi:2-polyprenyl-3-methyl-5-hydroxy-6-metoxy-1,4-benzoquinol methylase
MSKSQFLLKTLVKYAALQPSTCPYCLSARTALVERKNGLWQLRRCDECLLNFRFPKDVPAESAGFYQRAYRQDKVTDLPPEEDIQLHVANRFARVGRDLTTHLKTIQAMMPRGRILDYGCSWGYCVHQLAQAGYEASGYEVSRPRVEYGRKTLKQDLTSDPATLPREAFDAIYSAHVLEHIPNPRNCMTAFGELLKTGGKLFLYVPNCSGDDARKLGVKWGPMINEKHVLALTAEFFHRNLPRHGFSTKFASSPYAMTPQPYDTNWDRSGEELLVVGTRES